MSLIRGVVVYFDNRSIFGVVLPPPPFPGFSWDAETDVSESYPASASEHPIQAGASDVTDNIHTMSAQISVSGIVSSMPISRPAKMPGLNVDGSQFSSNAAVAMKELLLGYRKQRRRLIVASSRGTWSPCLLLNVDVKWGPSEGSSLNISAVFKQIRIAKQQLVPAVADADLLAAGSQTVNVGTWGGGL